MNKKHFPLLEKITYLDSAAGALKPIAVAKAISDFYMYYPINAHSSESELGDKVIGKINASRQAVATLVGTSTEEVIFTSGTTDGLNKIARMLDTLVSKGDEILLSPYNHASNYIVWTELAKRVGATIVQSKDIVQSITSKTKIVAYAQVNNVINVDYDVKAIFEKAKSVGAIVINDAAQAIVHEKVEAKYCDALVFSGNKIYGPTGVGALIISKDLQAKTEPSTFGGGANYEYDQTKNIAVDCVGKYEAGTLNTAGIIGLGAAIEYFNENVDYKKEEIVANHCFDELTKLDKAIVHSVRGDRNVIFEIKGIHCQDVASFLGYENIIIRAGHHCAKTINACEPFTHSLRVSIASYNTKEDIDILIKALIEEEDFIVI